MLENIIDNLFRLFLYVVILYITIPIIYPIGCMLYLYIIEVIPNSVYVVDFWKNIF